MSNTFDNLLADAAPPTRLPVDPATLDLATRGPEAFAEVIRAHPESSMCWALLAEGALDAALTEPATADADLAAYAYARTGYHRGLDALRRAGWKGSGPVPWEHEPNRGFLRALWALTVAAQRIGDTAEHERCGQFLRDSSATAYEELNRSRPPSGAPA